MLYQTVLAEATISSVMSDVETVASSVFKMAGDAVNFVTGHPVILVFTLVSLCGVGVGLLKRFVH